jgi:hypothetical protein
MTLANVWLGVPSEALLVYLEIVNLYIGFGEAFFPLEKANTQMRLRRLLEANQP